MLLKRAQAIFTALCLVCANARADGVSEGQELARQAIAAADAGDHATAADLLRKALVLRPNHPSATYRYAKESAHPVSRSTANSSTAICSADVVSPRFEAMH